MVGMFPKVVSVHNAEQKANKMAESNFQAVLVTWIDAHAYEGGSWVYPSDIEDTGDYIVKTIGWLMPSGDGGFANHASVAQSWGADDAVDHIINIPNGMVKSIQFLQPFTKEIPL